MTSKNRLRNPQRLVGHPMSSGLMLKAGERSGQHTHEVRRLGSRSDFATIAWHNLDLVIENFCSEHFYHYMN